MKAKCINMKAKCINADSAGPYLKIGEIYDVVQDPYVPDFFRVVGGGGAGWDKCRFEILNDFGPEANPPASKVEKTTLPTKVEKTTLPTDATARKNIPIVRGCLDYFPAALAAVAELSRIGNEQHNPGEPMHHARGKSTDHADCIVRHTMQRGTVDTDGVRHATKAAWRALALLQEELEAAGAPLARGAKLPKP